MSTHSLPMHLPEENDVQPVGPEKHTGHGSAPAIQSDHRPVRSTRGVLPSRYAEGRLDPMKNIRSNMARTLTRHINKAREAMRLQRSLRTLGSYYSQISDALQALLQAHGLFRQQLTMNIEHQAAEQWMCDREKVANVVLEDLDTILTAGERRSNSIPSSPSCHGSETSHRSAISRSESSQNSLVRHKLRLEAEHAQLELAQTKRRVEVEKARVKQQQEAEAATTKLLAQELIEKAELKAKLSREVLEEEFGVHVKTPVALPKTEPVDLVSTWLIKQDADKPATVETKGDDNVQSITIAKEPRPLVTDVVTTSATKTVLTSATTAFPMLGPNISWSNPHTLPANVCHPSPSPMQHMKEEAFDAWISKLVPVVETNMLHTDTVSTSDHLIQAIMKIESERDLPKVELPIFEGVAITWPRFVEQFHVQVHCRPGISDARRMDLLQSHLKGEARLLVQGYWDIQVATTPRLCRNSN